VLAKGLIATAAVAALVAAATAVSASPGARRVTATAAQDQAALAIVKAKAYTRSVKLRRRAPLAEWSVRNTSQSDATGVNTCVQFPAGFEIKWKAADRPPGVEVTKSKRKACIPIEGGTIYVASSSDYIVEGFAPRKTGTFKVKFTATASNAAPVTKTVSLRILKHCTRKKCPGFTGS
jgi:hypothetical protein